MTGAGATLLGVTQGSHWGWESPLTIGAITIGIGAIVALVVVEQRVAHPLIDQVLFQSKGFVAALASAFLLFITLAPVG
ncbi:MAG TPA: MFS transporter, partial [Chloroflexi bacterium]|nr:MFS transporter [Chloroflexota bacterium]